MVDEDDESGGKPERPHVWGVWKPQTIKMSGATALERERQARAVLKQYSGLIRRFLCRPLPRNAAFSREDLEQVLRVVLLQAYSSYDASKCQFPTWAFLWMQQAHIDLVRRNKGLSRREQNLHRRMQKATGLDDEEREELENALQRRTVSLGAPKCEEQTYEDTLAAEAETIDAVVERHEVHDWLYEKIGNGILDSREKKILYGLLNNTPTETLAADLALTRQRVQQIRDAAFAKIRQAALEEGVEP